MVGERNRENKIVCDVIEDIFTYLLEDPKESIWKSTLNSISSYLRQDPSKGRYLHKIFKKTYLTIDRGNYFAQETEGRNLLSEALKETYTSQTFWGPSWLYYRLGSYTVTFLGLLFVVVFGLVFFILHIKSFTHVPNVYCDFFSGL